MYMGMEMNILLRLGWISIAWLAIPFIAVSRKSSVWWTRKRGSLIMLQVVHGGMSSGLWRGRASGIRERVGYGKGVSKKLFKTEKKCYPMWVPTLRYPFQENHSVSARRVSIWRSISKLETPKLCIWLNSLKKKTPSFCVGLLAWND